MTASSRYSQRVRVKIEQGESGAFFASSPDLEGLLAMSPDRKELEEKLIPQYIADLYKVAGHPVVVTRMETEPTENEWVTTPLELAKKALEAARAA